MQKYIIVVDTANRPYYNNKLFDSSIAEQYPGAMAMCRFYELATAAGYQVVTADCLDRSGYDTGRMIVVSEQVTPWTEDLARRGALLGVLFSLETPSFAWRFYRNLRQISKRYKHVFLFKGSAKWVDDGSVQFHPTLFPQPDGNVAEVGRTSWDNRLFMTMINSNLVRYVKPAQWLASIADPDLRRELYSERRKAVRHFCKNKGFHLYGRGWNKKMFMVSKSDHKAALSCYKGSCEDKVATLSNYRYAICFENTIFPGYITEKIFDCFYAGCVPIYFGAPDICDYIPKECFIDFRDFSDYPALTDFLARLGSKEYESYRQSAAVFLESEKFHSFSQDYFAKNLLFAVNDCVAQGEQNA